ncbi:MAG: lysophospholipid acyltransferase family protein [Syntrophaceae bacterium]|nr:lysophospholipid acyltransferase family protein [Syntrophaceae bacterium]
MFKKLRNIARTRTAGTFIYWLVRFYCSTFRLKIENESSWINYLEQGGKVLICLWHQHLFTTIHIASRYRKYQVGVMVSQSLDGDIASRIFESGGMITVRGSSSRGGLAALREMIKRVKQYNGGVHVLDGPRGPVGIIKPGVITLANSAGAVIVPMVVIADRAWYLHSWDRFMIPKPFARVELKFLSKIELPKAMDEDEYENQIRMLEEIMKPYLRL